MSPQPALIHAVKLAEPIEPFLNSVILTGTSGAAQTLGYLTLATFIANECYDVSACHCQQGESPRHGGRTHQQQSR